MIINLKFVGVCYVKKNGDVGDNCFGIYSVVCYGFFWEFYIKIRNLKGNNNM